MRILQLTPRLPYPPVDGGRIAMLQIAQALQRAGSVVHILSLNPYGDDVAAAERALAPIGVEAVSVSTAPSAGVFWRALRTRTSPFIARFFHTVFQRALERQGPFDVVQIESPFMLPYLPTLRARSAAPVVLRAHNVEFRIWEQLARDETRLSRRLLYSTIARQVQRWEIRGLNQVDAVLPITAEDGRDFAQLGCVRPMHVLPAGIAGGVAVEAEAAEPNVGFLAALDYLPNQQAAIWIAEELHPRLLRLAPSAQIRIAGRRPPPWLVRKLRAAGISVEADIADASAFLSQMRVVIAPIFSGGGMRIKVLEAMGAARAVVATTLGGASMGARDGEHWILADDADSFAAAVATLVGDRQRAQNIGRAAREFVTKHYAVDGLARDLLAFYGALLQRPLPASEAETLANINRRSSSSDHPHM